MDVKSSCYQYHHAWFTESTVTKHATYPSPEIFVAQYQFVNSLIRMLLETSSLAQSGRMDSSWVRILFELNWWVHQQLLAATLGDMRILKLCWRILSTLNQCELHCVPEDVHLSIATTAADRNVGYG